MNNLKRVLSLGLTGAMLTGMMVMGASAAKFNDADKITHTEAVNTMVALGVLKGKDTGNYDPQGIVTRAEMAKIICVSLNGGEDPTLGVKATPTYKDIKGHWAESYIEYCTSIGVIAGQGDGTFAPDATVTGSAAAKMFLVALGYDSDVFGFTGMDWEINTNVQANDAKLYDELKGMNASAGLSRDNAAQMAFNAMEAKLMTKTYDKVLSNGEISYNYNLGSQTFLNKYFGADTFIGTYMGNDKTISSLDEGSIQVKGKLDTAEANANDVPANLPSDLDISNIGEEVKVIFKDGKGGQAGKPDKRDTIYGVFNTGATDVVTGTMGLVKDNKSEKAQLNIDGTKYDTKDTVAVYVNYVLSDGNSDAEGTDYSAKGSSSTNSALTTFLKQANGNTIKAVTDPEDGKIETVYVTASKIAAVTAKNSEKITLNNGVGTIKIADNEVYEDVKKGDVVVATTLYASSAADDNAYTIVKKAEVVSGKVDSYKTTTKESVTSYENVKLDGTTYKIYNKATMLNAIPDETVTTTFGDDDIGETFDLYLVNGYVGAAIQTSESASNYSLVTAVKTGASAGSTFNALELQVMDAEGKKTIITVSDDSAVKTASGYTVGDIVVYTGSADDAVVTIKGKLSTGTVSYNEKTKAVSGKVTTSDAVLFAETTDYTVGGTSEVNAGKSPKYKAYSIRSLDSFSAVKGVSVTNSDGKVVAVFADLGGTASGATDTTVYGIVTGLAGRVSIDDTKYYQYTVAVNDKEYVVNLAANTVIAVGDLVSFEPSSDDTYGSNDITVYTSLTTNKVVAYVKEYNEADGTLTYFTAKEGSVGNYTGKAATQATLALDDDCAIVYVNADDDEAGSEIGVNAFDSVTGYANALVVTKTTGTGDSAETVIVAIFVETSNECDIM